MSSTAVNRLRPALDALVERIGAPAPTVPTVLQDAVDRLQGFAAEHSLGGGPHVKAHICLAREPSRPSAPSFLNDGLQVSSPLTETARDAAENVFHSNPLVLSAAKDGRLMMLAKGAAIEWAPRNIRVNAVAPSLTATPVIEACLPQVRRREATRRQREGQIPHQRLTTSEAIADAVLSLASSESSYITGAALPVDGGWTAFQHRPTRFPDTEEGHT